VKLPTLFREWADPTKLAQIYAQAQRHTAADILSQAVVTGPDDDVGRVAWLMARRGQGRVLVVEDGMLVGIVTRGDIIRMLARMGQPVPMRK
jgi:predicted transcriptional regulator